MDVPRPSQRRRKIIKRTAAVLGATVLIVGTSIVLARLEPAAPEVERATVWLDTVRRGEMLRQVRGLGTLVPEQILWIPATTDGRVEQILILPGTPVRADTVLLVLSNPELEQGALDAEWKLRAGESELKNLRVKLKSERLTQEAAAATVYSDFQQARLQANRDVLLNKEGLLPELQMRLSTAKADDLANRYNIEKERLSIGTESIEAQIAVQQAGVEQLRAMLALKKSQVEALKVRAGADGVLQQIAVEVGQRVAAGTSLARVAQPEKLKAELKIAETQAKDIQIGQHASIDTRNGVVMGRVSRIDPAVREGTVTVDVKLEEKLPEGARPDLSVDGIVEIEKLSDVVYVGRPTIGQPNSQVSLFRLDPGSKQASKVPVKLGRASVTVIEVLEGLQPGDQVILSDMSAWDSHDRIRLN
ncbi:MAG: HlyD family efflux transporter periplasmic adaptor subunit [Bryobacteraceae bacterium]|nr:HlyD family efflux transporter periplasmic adaptor subunit [Bryobacteraceae bacterium]